MSKTSGSTQPRPAGNSGAFSYWAVLIISPGKPVFRPDIVEELKVFVLVAASAATTPEFGRIRCCAISAVTSAM
jgi:hypothetical protein